MLDFIYISLSILFLAACFGLIAFASTLSNEQAKQKEEKLR